MKGMSSRRKKKGLPGVSKKIMQVEIVLSPYQLNGLLLVVIIGCHLLEKSEGTEVSKILWECQKERNDVFYCFYAIIFRLAYFGEIWVINTCYLWNFFSFSLIL